MRDEQRNRRLPQLTPLRIFSIALLFVLAIGLACRAPATDSSNETQIALNVQATQLAQSSTQTAQAKSEAQVEEEEQEGIVDQQATYDAQATNDAQALTQIALDVQATMAAQPSDTPRPTKTPDPAGGEGQFPQDPSAPGGQSVNQAEFQAWMQSASILLFEDMAFLGVVQPVLDSMSLDYVDVDDALGNFKNQLLSGGPNGQGWDLIISAKEAREIVSGEFYVYINDALNSGSSVIIEEWNIDGIASGKIAAILGRCGVEFQKDWSMVPLDEQLLFPINGEHPIHHVPNEGISLTNPTGVWPEAFDLGDLLRLRPGSDAILLWGARSAIKDSYATAVVCNQGRLIIQTYGSHSYGADRIGMMWANYIYNALQARYQFLMAQQQ